MCQSWLRDGALDSAFKVEPVIVLPCSFDSEPFANEFAAGISEFRQPGVFGHS